MKGFCVYFLLLFVLLTNNCFAGPGGPGGPPQVMVAKVGQADVAEAQEYVGHVEAIERAALTAQISGVIADVHVSEGAIVHQGDLLVSIEDSLYKTQRAAAEAARSQAEAAVQVRKADLAAAQAAVEVAEAKLSKERAEVVRAEKYLKRIMSVDPRGLVQADRDKAESTVAQAQAAVLEAQAELNQRQAQVRQVASLQQSDAAALLKAQAAVETAEVQLSYTTITAPINGRIGRMLVTRGNLVSPATGPIVEVIQENPVRVVYSISEKDVTPLLAALTSQEKEPIEMPTLRFADGGVSPAPGLVSFVDNEIDQRTGTLAVRADFSNDEGKLIVGQYVTVVVKQTAPKLLPVVPQAAVLVSKEGRSVLMLNEQSIVTPRPITTGAAVGSQWAVTSGLQAGEEIIVSGLQKVRPGMPAVAQTKPEKGNAK